jgi:hypothetical protein
MSGGRLFVLGPIAIVGALVAALPFIPPRQLPHGIPMQPPSDGPLLQHRHPQLFQVERDLASGKLSLADAVEITLPLVQEDERLAKATAYQGKGIRPGVALMLCGWVEKIATDNPEAVSDATLEQLYADLGKIGHRD